MDYLRSAIGDAVPGFSKPNYAHSTEQHNAIKRWEGQIGDLKHLRDKLDKSSREWHEADVVLRRATRDAVKDFAMQRPGYLLGG